MKKVVILVTDGHLRSSLAVVRSLGRAGYEVHVCSRRSRSLAQASRYTSSHAVVADSLTKPGQFADDIAALVRYRRIDVLIAMAEESLLAILPRQDILNVVCLPFAPLEAFLRAADKNHVTALASTLGMAVPEQCVLHSRAAAVEMASSVQRFPVVLKPARSVAGEGADRTKLGVSYANDPQEFSRAVATLPAVAFPLLVQQRIVGPGSGIFQLLWDGTLVAQFAHRRIREKPPSGGVAVLAESIPADPEVARQALTLLRALDWRGPAMIEFKMDAATGRYYLMEVNGRFWGSLQLAIDAGVDFPRLLVASALGDRPEPILTYRIGIKTRWWWGDVDHLLARLRSKDRFSESGGGFHAIRQFMTPGADVRNEICRSYDPWPSVRETIEWFRRR